AWTRTRPAISASSASAPRGASRSSARRRRRPRSATRSAAWPTPARTTSCSSRPRATPTRCTGSPTSSARDVAVRRALHVQLVEQPKETLMPGLETTDEMFDLRMSDGAKPLLAKVKAFVREEVEPVTLRFFQLGEGRAERWSWAPGQLELLDGLKKK